MLGRRKVKRLQEIVNYLLFVRFVIMRKVVRHMRLELIDRLRQPFVCHSVKVYPNPPAGTDMCRGSPQIFAFVRVARW